MKQEELPKVVRVEQVPFCYFGEATGKVRAAYAVRIDNLQDGTWRENGLWGLSPEMCSQIVDARFVIDTYGRVACAHLWHEGLGLWNDPLLKPFDTMVRDMLLAPAVSAIWSGFYLLADYLYDPATESYDRKRKQIIARIMAYAWWWKKTGRGCVAEHARLNDKRTPEVVELYSQVRSREIALAAQNRIEVEAEPDM